MRLSCLCLEPPGPVRRELALFRRRLFAATGEATALALPELLFLGQIPFSRSGSSSSISALRAALPALWDLARGPFSSSAPFAENGRLYLGLTGPLSELREAAAESLGAFPWPLLSERGFFLLRGGEEIEARDNGPEMKPDKPLESALRLEPPRFSFFSAKLLILELEFGPDPLRAQAWRELGSARRLSGRR